MGPKSENTGALEDGRHYICLYVGKDDRPDSLSSSPRGVYAESPGETLACLIVVGFLVSRRTVRPFPDSSVDPCKSHTSPTRDSVDP